MSPHSLAKIQRELSKNTIVTPYLFAWIRRIKEERDRFLHPLGREGQMSRILVVEDGAIFREILRTTLQSRFPSMEIFEVTTGEEALEQVEALSPELVFIDIRLPDGNGLELTRIIKAKHPETKVVILTNYDLPEYREAASHFKADHFILKDTFMEMINSIFFQDPQGPQVG